MNYAIDMTGKADILWHDSDIYSKLKLQEALFPEGVAYDPEEGFLNPPISEAFNLLGVLNASESFLVAAKGLEPLTRGL